MRDYAGPNTLLKAFQLIRQAIKNASPAAGDGLSKEGDTLSVTTPVRGIFTQAEFDALTEAQKNSGLYVISDGSGEPGGGSSAGEVYSTEETRIGTWIDGKPLYRRVFQSTSPTEGSTAKSVADLSDTSVDLVTRADVILKTRTGDIVYPDSNSSSTSIRTSKYFSGSTRQLLIKIISLPDALNSPVTTIVEYTKTTDQATVAVSVPTAEESANLAMDMSAVPAVPMPVTSAAFGPDEED